MIQNKNQNINNNNNFIWENQINDLKNTSAIINNFNIHNNNIINNYVEQNVNNNIRNNDKNDNNVISVIFKMENGNKYSTVTFNRCKLMDLFSVISAQMINNDYSDIYTLKFLLNARDITKHFLNN